MNEKTISDAVRPVLEQHGLELDRLEIIPAGRRKVVRITVDGDGPNGRGPRLDDIADATRDISEALDAADTGSQPYTLEVSSRGVGRPLTEAKHFRRNISHLAAITTREGDQFTGRITAVDGDVVTFDRNGTPVALPVSAIKRASVEVEMNRPVDLDLDQTDLSDDVDDLSADGLDDEFDDDELADDELADDELAAGNAADHNDDEEI